jgi:hypothetical protein
MKIQNVEQFGIIFLPLLCNILFFNMLALSSEEHLEIGFSKMWVVSAYAELAILENGTKICSENYCLLGCDANAVW